MTLLRQHTSAAGSPAPARKRQYGSAVVDGQLAGPGRTRRLAEGISGIAELPYSCAAFLPINTAPRSAVVNGPLSRSRHHPWPQATHKRSSLAAGNKACRWHAPSSLCGPCLDTVGYCRVWGVFALPQQSCINRVSTEHSLLRPGISSLRNVYSPLQPSCQPKIDHMDWARHSWCPVM